MIKYKIDRYFTFLGCVFTIRAYTKSDNPHSTHVFNKDGLIIVIRRNGKLFVVYTRDYGLENGDLAIADSATLFTDISLKEAKVLLLNYMINVCDYDKTD